MIGEIIGNVRITSEIGEGSTGKLYMGEHVNVGKPFAVKHLAPELAQNQMYHERFIKETKALAQLKHDNIVRIYDVIEKEGHIFLVMEYADGETLDVILRNRGVLPEKEALSIARGILKALNYAHSKGIIHRDIKPSNIMCTKDGRVKLMDFGIALMGRGARLTKAGKVMGAAKYMSPEQIAQEKQINHQSDIYSLGIIVYEMLTGQVPFEGETDSEIYEKHEKATPPAMQSIVENIPSTLNKIVMRALEKNPEERYRGSVDFLKYLQAYDSGDVEKVAKEEEAKKEAAALEEPPEEVSEELEPVKPAGLKIGKGAMIGMGVAAVFIIAIAVFMTLRFLESRQMKAEYEGVLALTAKEKNLEKKQKILSSYIKSHEKNDYTKNAEKRIKELEGFIQERDYRIASSRADILRSGKDYEKAAAALREYLKKYPSGKLAAQSKRKLSEIVSLMDERDYEKLKDLPSDDYNARIKAYSSYMTNYPQGKNREVVVRLFSEISERYYNYLKDELIECDKSEKWEGCIQLCDHFINSLKESEHIEEIKTMRADLDKKVLEKKALAKLMKEAELRGENYNEAKKIYSAYLKSHPDSTSYMRGKIENLLFSLDKKREWENTLAYCRNEQKDLGKRISRLRQYIKRESTGPYIEDSKRLLRELESEERAIKKGRRLAALQKKRDKEDREWNEIYSIIVNPEVDVFERIRRLETYISQNSSERYARDARSELKKLKAEGKEWTRIEGIRKKLKVQLAKSGEVMIDNGDDTVQDKRTGLTWCLLDSTDVLKKCLNYEDAKKYVKKLKTGRHGNWRLPTARELALIYKSEPFFPSIKERWYWTSETRGRASWQTVSIVNSKKDRSFSIKYVNVKKCGAVRAVRR